MTRIIASLLIFAAFVVAPLASSAVPIITVPPDLNPGDKYRLAFVTSTTRDATDVLIGPYNDFVTAVAAGVPELAALGTTWKAIGSTTGIDARDNTGTNPNVSAGVPIYRLDDTRIADNNADLWDGLISAHLGLNESGSLVGSGVRVWTGTSPEGTASFRILGDPEFAVYGGAGNTTAFWINVAGWAPGNTETLYAMSGALTVIPEPSTMILACFGATAVVGWQLRRRRHRRRQ
jgi:hypothetical protein